MNIIDKIKKTVKAFKKGIISQQTMDLILNEKLTPIHGAYDVNKNQFIGYNYKTQEWIEFNC